MGVNIHCKGYMRCRVDRLAQALPWQVCITRARGAFRDITRAGITGIMAAGKEYREFTDFFTSLPEDSWEIRQTPLTGLGGDMIHWGFGKV